MQVVTFVVQFPPVDQRARDRPYQEHFFWDDHPGPSQLIEGDWQKYFFPVWRKGGRQLCICERGDNTPLIWATHHEDNHWSVMDQCWDATGRVVELHHWFSMMMHLMDTLYSWKAAMSVKLMDTSALDQRIKHQLLAQMGFKKMCT